MRDYILIQSTQLFCKVVASYPSGGVGYHGSRRWPLILRAGFGNTVSSSPQLPFRAKTSDIHGRALRWSPIKIGIKIGITALGCGLLSLAQVLGITVFSPLLYLHSPLRHPRHGTAMVTPIKTLDRDGSLRTTKTQLCSQGTHLPLECTNHPPTLGNSG